MRLPTLLLAASIPLIAFSRTADTYTFKRIFKDQAKSSFVYTAGPHGEKLLFTCQYTETTTAVAGDGATEKFEIQKLDLTGAGGSEIPPPLTSKVGPDNMPAAASIKNGTEFIVFGSLAGITPNSSAKVGDTVIVHWQNDSKDVTFDGSGKLDSVDATAKTLTVSWDIKMTPADVVGGTYKFKSVYSLDDFTVQKSEGTFTIGGTVMDIALTRPSP